MPKSRQTDEAIRLLNNLSTPGPSRGEKDQDVDNCDPLDASAAKLKNSHSTQNLTPAKIDSGGGTNQYLPISELRSERSDPEDIDEVDLLDDSIADSRCQTMTVLVDGGIEEDRLVQVGQSPLSMAAVHHQLKQKQHVDDNLEIDDEKDDFMDTFRAIKAELKVKEA